MLGKLLLLGELLGRILLRNRGTHSVHSSGGILLWLVGACGVDGRSGEVFLWASNSSLETLVCSRGTPVEVNDFGLPDVGVASHVGHDSEDEEGESVEHEHEPVEEAEGLNGLSLRANASGTVVNPVQGSSGAGA